MIELRALGAKAGKFSLGDIDLRIAPGECHVIVGPTGSGKTVLLETIIGLREHFSGGIYLDGKNVAGLPPHDRHISYVPQDICLFPNMNVQDNIWYGVSMRPWKDASDEGIVDRLVEFFHVRHLLDRFPKNLSGGERQRVALVRALAPKPLLLVLDEPFSAIDHSKREEIRRLMKEFFEEYKTTTLIVTHDLDEAFFLGDRISILMDGQIRQSGDRDQIYYYPKTGGAAVFLGIKNLFSGIVEEIEDEAVVLFCEDLAGRVTVNCRCSRKRFAVKQSVRFGIRAESVYILRSGHESREKRNVFSGRVKKLYRRGRIHTLLVEVQGGRKTVVEIDIHDAAARKVGIMEDADLQMSLNPGFIFLLTD
jgi:ABC-type Fe3+/spermidine/putrescine transport system ATPase subunit